MRNDETQMFYGGDNSTEELGNNNIADSKKKSGGGNAAVAGGVGAVVGAGIGVGAALYATAESDAKTPEPVQGQGEDPVSKDDTADPKSTTPAPADAPKSATPAPADAPSHSANVSVHNDVHHLHVDAHSFSDAFAQARAELGPGGVFEYHGKLYGTYYESEWRHMSAHDRAEFQRIALNHHHPVNNINVEIHPTVHYYEFAQVHVQAPSFSDAFAQARAELGPGGVFEYNGKLYNTFYSSEWNNMSPQARAEFQSSVFGHGVEPNLMAVNTCNYVDPFCGCCDPEEFDPRHLIYEPVEEPVDDPVDGVQNNEDPSSLHFINYGGNDEVPGVEDPSSLQFVNYEPNGEEPGVEDPSSLQFVNYGANDEVPGVEDPSSLQFVNYEPNGEDPFVEDPGQLMASANEPTSWIDETTGVIADVDGPVDGDDVYVVGVEADYPDEAPLVAEADWNEPSLMVEVDDYGQVDLADNNLQPDYSNNYQEPDYSHNYQEPDYTDNYAVNNEVDMGNNYDEYVPEVNEMDMSNDLADGMDSYDSYDSYDDIDASMLG